MEDAEGHGFCRVPVDGRVLPQPRDCHVKQTRAVIARLWDEQEVMLPAARLQVAAAALHTLKRGGEQWLLASVATADLASDAK